MVNINKSLQMQERAKRLIPGMTQLLSKRPDMFSLGVWPGYFSKAKGVEVWDLDGNKYIDMSISGIGANVLGYADPDVDTAVKNAIANGTSCSLNCPEEVELAELLCELHPWVEMVRYARTGGEAMAIAVRIARAYTGRDKIAFCGYHGWHDWYLAANLGTENALGEHLISGLNPAGVPKALTGTAIPFRYNHLHELESIVATHIHELAAIVMEPIRNEDPQPGFLEGVRGLADKANAVLIFDETITGFRLALGGATERFGVTPDLGIYGKGLGGGVPISCLVGNEKFMKCIADFTVFHAGTFNTNLLALQGALTTLEVLMSDEDKIYKRWDKLGEKLRSGLHRLTKKHGLNLLVKGIGQITYTGFSNNNRMETYRDCWSVNEEKVERWTSLLKEYGVRIIARGLWYLSTVHTEAEIDKALSAADSVLTTISEETR